MFNGFSEELRENETHDEQGEKGREDTPDHSQIRALIFFLKIAFDKLGKKKTLFFYFCQHGLHAPFKYRMTLNFD